MKTAAGAIEETVIDPSTQSGPVPIAAWLAAMGVAPGDVLAQDACGADGASRRAAARADDRGASRAGEQIVYTTDRNTMFPGQGPHADSAHADAKLEGLNPRMTGYAALAATHEIAAAVRTELARPGCTAADVIAAVRKGAPAARGGALDAVRASCAPRSSRASPATPRRSMRRSARDARMARDEHRRRADRGPGRLPRHRQGHDRGAARPFAVLLPAAGRPRGLRGAARGARAGVEGRRAGPRHDPRDDDRLGRTRRLTGVQSVAL